MYRHEDFQLKVLSIEKAMILKNEDEVETLKIFLRISHEYGLTQTTAMRHT